MSHELRTPLTSVLGFAALLADGLGSALEPRHARYLENIRESGNQLLRLINNLLDQAKIEAGRMDLQLEPASLDAIVESALSMMEGYGATRGVHLSASSAREVPAIVVDVAKLRQAILNLLSNAIKFSGRGSEVEVRTRFLPARSPSVDSDTYEIVVADQGPGIEPADQERIFEPFRQLATRGETVPGTGLGLSIARQFIALLGGVARSRVGGRRGAAFRIRLPVDATARAQGARRTARRRDVRPRAIGRGWSCSSRTAGDSRRWPAISNARVSSRCVRPTATRRAGCCASCGRRWSRSTSIPARLEAWTTLLALEHDLSRAGTPLVLFAFAAGSERGVAASFERLLHAPASGGELVSALEIATAGIGTGGGRKAAREPGRRAVWLACRPAQRPARARSGARRRPASPAQRPASPSRALAQAAGGEFGAIVVDLADRPPAASSWPSSCRPGEPPTSAWIALAPAELTSSERKRLVEFVESAAGSGRSGGRSGGLRVTRGAPRRRGPTASRRRARETERAGRAGQLSTWQRSRRTETV